MEKKVVRTDGNDIVSLLFSAVPSYPRTLGTDINHIPTVGPTSFCLFVLYTFAESSYLQKKYNDPAMSQSHFHGKEMETKFFGS